jgi:hypothetical protein
MAGYLLIAYVLRSRTRRERDRFVISTIFDSATFAGSSMLLVGILEPSVLSLLGNTKPFLLVAGLAGLLYSFHALFPEVERR